MATEQQTKDTTTMEINGRPFYVKSDEKGNPHLYDIDTNEDVGYWCQKSGTYVMFSPYEQIMNRLKRLNEEDLKNNVKEKETEGTEEEDDDNSVEDDDSSVEDDDDSSVEDDDDSVEDDETKKIENLWSNTVFVKFIILMLIYNMFQKMVQSIYVDFAFAFAFTILYTKMARVVSSEL
uniref:Uncharacterized protein n=1 Tax=viral metagenome TaxID=1070528 RepID=A0A6C0F1D4_9ZZZZ